MSLKKAKSTKSKGSPSTSPTPNLKTLTKDLHALAAEVQEQGAKGEHVFTLLGVFQSSFESSRKNLNESIDDLNKKIAFINQSSFPHANDLMNKLQDHCRTQEKDLLDCRNEICDLNLSVMDLKEDIKFMKWVAYFVAVVMMVIGIIFGLSMSKASAETVGPLISTVPGIVADAAPKKAEPKVGNNVVLLGDWGNGSQDQKDVAAGAVKYCKKNKCDFVITLGDNFYNGPKDVYDKRWKTWFEDVYAELGLIFRPSLGNHEYDGGGDPNAQVEYSKLSTLWAMPARYYKLEYDDILYVAIDSEVIQAQPEQKEWIKKTLSESKAKWKIVYGHHPRKQDILDLVIGKADFYLAGHEHSKQYQNIKGLNLVVCGTGGRYQDKKYLGVCHLSIDGNKASVKFIDRAGQVHWQKAFKKNKDLTLTEPI